MKIKNYKCKCGHENFFFADKGNQKGIYCSYCGKWLKWAGKDEQNLDMKQESVLDNILSEIENLNVFYVPNKTYVSESDVLNIINKYRNESEE